MMSGEVQVEPGVFVQRDVDLVAGATELSDALRVRPLMSSGLLLSLSRDS